MFSCYSFAASRNIMTNHHLNIVHLDSHTCTVRACVQVFEYLKCKHKNCCVFLQKFNYILYLITCVCARWDMRAVLVHFLSVSLSFSLANCMIACCVNACNVCDYILHRFCVRVAAFGSVRFFSLSFSFFSPILNYKTHRGEKQSRKQIASIDFGVKHTQLSDIHSKHYCK